MFLLVLCLQFKQKIGPQHQPQPPAPDDDDDDDDDDDEDDTSVPSSTPETAPPPTASSSSTTAAAAVPYTSGVSKSSMKKSRTPGDPDIVLASCVSLSPKPLGQQTINQHGDRFT